MAITDLLAQLPPNARKYALVAGGAGAVFLVVRSMRSEPVDPDSEDAGVAGDDGTTTVGYGGGFPLYGGADVIGVDQLMDFESHIATELADLRETVSAWDAPHAPSTTPSSPPGTVHWTYVQTVAGGKGESANAIAIRLRGAGGRTADGRDITAAYLMRFNQWTGSTSDPRWPGSRVAY